MNNTKAASNKPDQEFEGYAWTRDGQKILCRIAIWLPWDHHEDGRMEAELFQVQCALEDLLSITKFSTHDDPAKCSFQAFDPLIRQIQHDTNLRHTGGVRLSITHVRNWLMCWHLGSSVNQPAFEVTLNDFNYGLPSDFSLTSRDGSRSASAKNDIELMVLDAQDWALSIWQLQRHWHWKTQDETHISASASPVLQLLNNYAEMTEDQLGQTAHDLCMLISLAARHRIHIYRTVHQHAQVIEDNWINPLERPRATTEEEARGPLVHSAELGLFVKTASKAWASFDNEMRDAFRLAVFAVHPTTMETMESRFLNLFASLEGLVKRRMNKKTGDKFCPCYQDFRELFPIEMGPLLWPICKPDMTNLYWFRNEFAHGRTVMHLPPGVLPTAIDHLQLVVEFTLLALLGFQRQNRSDWLTREQVRNREKNDALMESIRHLSSGPSRD